MLSSILPRVWQLCSCLLHHNRNCSCAAYILPLGSAHPAGTSPPPPVAAARDTMRSPLLTAVGAGAGTFVTLTFVTGAVSGVALSVAKRVLRHRKVGQSW